MPWPSGRSPMALCVSSSMPTVMNWARPVPAVVEHAERAVAGVDEVDRACDDALQHGRQVEVAADREHGVEQLAEAAGTSELAHAPSIVFAAPDATRARRSPGCPLPRRHTGTAAAWSNVSRNGRRRSWHGRRPLAPGVAAICPSRPQYRRDPVSVEHRGVAELHAERMLGERAAAGIAPPEPENAARPLVHADRDANRWQVARRTRCA